MMNKPTMMLFYSILMLSVLISISANSWLTVWMGMEINLMSFLPLMMKKKSLHSKESSLTYFLIQTIASMLLLMSLITTTLNMLNMHELMLTSALMIKSGVFPFHFWLPKTMEGMYWNECLILMTVQKVIPFMLMSLLIKPEPMTMMITIMSVMVGSIGGMNQTSLRKMMAYSSVTNNGWMITAMMISQSTWMIYLMMYSITMLIMTNMMKKNNNHYINQMTSMNEPLEVSMFMLMNMLSISGLPPMLGFMPKFLVMQSNIMQMKLVFMMTITMMTMITIYYYLRMMFSTMMLTTNEMKWKTYMKTKNNKTTIMSMTPMIGLTLITIMMSIN
uniref:NADH dehydrogenase subunit 2 n=1 Tax=Pulchriphyllium bioculatum TaxID=58609 RepID=UPI0025A993EE|nr:NADH dehydrogenase subunit 2 [Pulchriphyllium bioculatum]WID87094.1 NADH dehydrogenase subunit 2 [Pulchriphyllium bioculatum]